MARVRGCFYCEAPADPTVPALIPYCATCWSEEHPGVKARLAAHAASGLTVTELVGGVFAHGTVVTYGEAPDA